jgi:hypothetical protein
MRLFVVAALMMFARFATAQQAVPVVLLDEKDAQGRRVQFRCDTKTLEAEPIWTPGGEGPPVSLERATKIATETALRQSGKAHGVSFDSIRLLRNVFDYSGGRVVTWFWVFSIAPVIDEHPD